MYQYVKILVCDIHVYIHCAWTELLVLQEVPTPTPPQSPKSPIDQKDSAEQLASMVKTLSVGSSGDLQSISEAAKTFALTEGKYEEAVQMIYRRCYEDWRMSLTAAKLCNNLVQEIGNDFRSALLQVIQKDFRSK